MKKIISLVCLLFILCACTKQYDTITRNEAESLINDGAILIDVRTEEEYNGGHILDAINIPLDSISSIDIEKDKTIIVYCASGVRSLEASKELVKLGYQNIYNLDGGLLNWGDE